MRITDYYSPFVSSYNVLPCIVEMLATAFESVSAGNQKLPHNQFVCQRNGLELKLVGNQISPPLVYSDLVRLARLVLKFQQRYKMSGIEFFYLDGRRIQGNGNLYMLFAGNSTVGGGVEE